jgi:hypothetical protein
MTKSRKYMVAHNLFAKPRLLLTAASEWVSHKLARVPGTLRVSRTAITLSDGHAEALSNEPNSEFLLFLVNSNAADAIQADVLTEFRNIDDLVTAGFTVPKLLEAEEAKIPRTRYTTNRPSIVAEPRLPTYHAEDPIYSTSEFSFEITDFVPSSAFSQLSLELAPGKPFEHTCPVGEPQAFGMSLAAGNLSGRPFHTLGVPPGLEVTVGPIYPDTIDPRDLEELIFRIPDQPLWDFTEADEPRKKLALACLGCQEKRTPCEPGASSCLQCE